MDKEIMTKLESHDKSFKTIDEKFVKIDERFDKIDEKFVKIDEKFVKIDEQFSRNEEVHLNITKKLLEHDDKFEEMIEGNRKNHAEVMEKFDQVLGSIKHLDIESTMASRRADRMQGEIDDNAKRTKKIEKVLKIA